MIVCRKCRTNNTDGDAFCGSCGAFLEWTGESVAVEVEEVAEEPEPEGTARKKSLVDKMRGVLDTALNPNGVPQETGEAWTGFGKEPAAGAKPTAPGASPSAPVPPPSAPGGPPKPPSPPSAPPKPPSPPSAPPKPPSPPSAPPKPPSPPSAPPKPPSPPSAPPKPPSPPSAPPKPPSPPSAPPKPPSPPSAPPIRELASDHGTALVVPVDGEADRRAGEPVQPRSAAKQAPMGGDQPEEVVPQRVQKRIAPVTKTKPSRRLKPGDLICGNCGEGNPATRKFCSRCGDELTTAEVVKVHWWSRLFRRKPKVMEAGARPGQKGKGARTPAGERIKRIWGLVYKAIGAFVVVTLLLSLFLPSVREPIDDLLGHPVTKVKDWWAGARDPYERVVPVDWGTNRIPLDGHTAQKAFDNNTQSYWATIWKPNERFVATRLTVKFQDPVKDMIVFVYPGAPGDDFTKYHSPSQIRFDYGDGRPNDTMTLAREEGASPAFKLTHADGVTSIDIWIEDVHDQKKATSVAISEFEFKEKD